MCTCMYICDVRAHASTRHFGAGSGAAGVLDQESGQLNPGITLSMWPVSNDATIASNKPLLRGNIVMDKFLKITAQHLSPITEASAK